MCAIMHENDGVNRPSRGRYLCRRLFVLSVLLSLLDVLCLLLHLVSYVLCLPMKEGQTRHAKSLEGRKGEAVILCDQPTYD